MREVRDKNERMPLLSPDPEVSTSNVDAGPRAVVSRPTALAAAFALAVSSLYAWFYLLESHPDAFSTVLVHTSLGTYEGYRERGRLADGSYSPVNVFRGMPYSGLVPVGRHRFHPARLANESWEGVRPARTFAAACMQPPSSAALFPASLLMDEDCLYLNVFAPPTAASLPVIVFVHGGGLRRGFSSLRRYWGNNMAANMQAVVVTLDYRLGPLGFLVLGNLSRGHDGEAGTGGMNGYNDVLVALQWVQADISNFGGDPNQVSLMGESSGSVAACALNTSPRAAGLFQSVIMESGACTGKLWGIQDARAGSSVAAAFMDDKNASSLQQLLDLPASELASWNEHDNRTAAFFLTHALAFVDGWVMHRLPRDAIAERQVNARRAILGANSVDTLLASSLASRAASWTVPRTASDFVMSVYGFARLMQYAYDVDDLDQKAFVDSVVELYPLSNYDGDAVHAFFQMDADAGVVCATKELARQLAGAGAEVFHYAFQYGPVHNDLAARRGYATPVHDGRSRRWASHAAELAFVFHNSCFDKHGEEFCVSNKNTEEWPRAANVLSARMMQAWGSFARGRHPNIEGQPLWSAVRGDDNETSMPTYIFDAPKVYSSTGYRDSICSFWSTTIG